MSPFDWIQLAFFLILLILAFIGIGGYLEFILDPEKPGLIEKWTGLGSKKEQTWKEYLSALLIFSCVSGLVSLLLLLFQSRLPLNPERFPDVPFALAFNIAISFLTNTDWQAYGGESTLSYFSQMVALTVQNFFSPAIGLAVAAVLCRAIAREGAATVGNFWVDLTRILYYLLLPLAVIFGILLIQQGTPQNFSPYEKVETFQSGGKQLIVQGPIASQESIKMLGTNGGGFTRVNSAHPFENPSLGTNFLGAFVVFLLVLGQLYYFGKKTRCLRSIWTVFLTILFIFALEVVLGTFCEKGNLEGKELRFGIFGSSLYTAASTLTSCGAVDAMLRSFTPLGGMIPLVNMQLGKSVFGGIGMGVCNLVLFALLAHFFVSMLQGRSTYFFGKRVGRFETGMAFLAFGLFFLAILGFIAASSGLARFSDVLYAYSSTAANNGSAFASLKANTPWFNYTLAAAMLLGRFGTLVPALAFAGSFAKQKRGLLEADLYPVSGVRLFAILLAFLIVIGLIIFLPSLLLGPLLEYVQIRRG